MILEHGDLRVSFDRFGAVWLQGDGEMMSIKPTELRWLCIVGGPAILSQLPVPEDPDPFTNEGRWPLPPFDPPEPPHPDQVEMEL